VKSVIGGVMSPGRELVHANEREIREKQTCLRGWIDAAVAVGSSLVPGRCIHRLAGRGDNRLGANSAVWGCCPDRLAVVCITRCGEVQLLLIRKRNGRDSIAE
jgi:hypothetical protein